MGSGALEGSLAGAAQRLGALAAALDGAVSTAAHNLDAGGEAYTVTDASAIPGPGT